MHEPMNMKLSLVHVLIYVPKDTSTLLMPGIEVGMEDRYLRSAASRP